MFFFGMNAVNAYFYLELTKEEKDLGGVSTKNREMLRDLIDHDTIGRKRIPGIIGQGIELAGMKCRNKEEFAIVKRLSQHPQIKDTIPFKKDGGREIQVKPICLLMAKMFNLFTKEELADKGI